MELLRLHLSRYSMSAGFRSAVVDTGFAPVAVIVISLTAVLHF